MTTRTTGATLRALSDELASAVERASRSLVAIHARPRIAASGVYWRDGLIVAANHTVRKDADIAVTMPDGSRGRASVVGRDGGTDLAVLRVESGSGAVVPEFAPDDELRVGHLMLAVGRPGDEGVTASLGVVSAVGGSWRTWSGGDVDHFVRLDLTIYDGFSGGPLVDASGRVAGINCSALARGLPLAIPAATVNRVVDALLTRGHVPRGFLGVAMQPVRLPPAMTQRLGLESDQGVMITMVDADSPAERAGLLLGDVVVAIEGNTIHDPEEVTEYLGADRVGSTIQISVVRGGTKTTVPVIVGERGAARDERQRRKGGGE
jgi:S1-C subfamily serine protease